MRKTYLWTDCSNLKWFKRHFSLYLVGKLNLKNRLSNVSFKTWIFLAVKTFSLMGKFSWVSSICSSDFHLCHKLVRLLQLQENNSGCRLDSSYQKWGYRHPCYKDSQLWLSGSCRSVVFLHSPLQEPLSSDMRLREWADHFTLFPINHLNERPKFECSNSKTILP